MRKLHISIALALLLLFAQHGAVLHEISHISQVSRADARLHADTQADRGCELCLAYSQVANPAGHFVDSVSFEPTAFAAPVPAPQVVVAASVPTPRSRGPPFSMHA
jgi:hypothetical protein